jgi:hypothetical protein
MSLQVQRDDTSSREDIFSEVSKTGKSVLAIAMHFCMFWREIEV